MAVSETNGNQSVGKALKIIEIFAELAEPTRLMDIAALAQMPSSTALRMITTLMGYGYIAQERDSQKYYLTLKFARIGSMAAARFNIRGIVHPHLARLSRDYGEASCAAVDSDMTALYVDVVDGPDGMLKIMQHIGKLSPLHCSGVGKCLLLDYDGDKLDTFVKAKGLPAFTANTITSQERLLAELLEVRQRGYAVDDEECELGARCVACGISDHSGRIVAAISMSGPVSRMTEPRVKAISASLMEAAREIAKSL